MDFIIYRIKNKSSIKYCLTCFIFQSVWLKMYVLSNQYSAVIGMFVYWHSHRKLIEFQKFLTIVQRLIIYGIWGQIGRQII